MLEYSFYGTDIKNKPKYLIGVEYINKGRNKLVVFEIEKIIEYLCESSFIIAPRNTVIKLGDSYSIQRKGGDGGKKGSNQCQIKITLSRLKVEPLLVKVF